MKASESSNEEERFRLYSLPQPASRSQPAEDVVSVTYALSWGILCYHGRYRRIREISFYTVRGSQSR